MCEVRVQKEKVNDSYISGAFRPSRYFQVSWFMLVIVTYDQRKLKVLL